MEKQVKFVLYLERILGCIVPVTKQSKPLLYKIRAQLSAERRFAGRALLFKVIDQASDYL